MKTIRILLIITIILAVTFVFLNIYISKKYPGGQVTAFFEGDIYEINNQQIMMLAPDNNNQRLTAVYQVTILPNTKFTHVIYNQLGKGPRKFVKSEKISADQLAKGQKIKVRAAFDPQNYKELNALTVELLEIVITPGPMEPPPDYTPSDFTRPQRQMP